MEVQGPQKRETEKDTEVLQEHPSRNEQVVTGV